MCMDSQVALLEFLSHWFKILLLELSCLILKQKNVISFNSLRNISIYTKRCRICKKNYLYKIILLCNNVTNESKVWHVLNYDKLRKSPPKTCWNKLKDSSIIIKMENFKCFIVFIFIKIHIFTSWFIFK